MTAEINYSTTRSFSLIYAIVPSLLTSPAVIYIYIYFKWEEKGKPLEYTEGCFPSHGRGGRITPHQRPLTSISLKLPLLMYADVRHSGDSPHPFRPAITERSLRVDGAAGGARHSWLRDPGRHDYRTTVGEATKRRKSQRSYCGNLPFSLELLVLFVCGTFGFYWKKTLIKSVLLEMPAT